MFALTRELAEQRVLGNATKSSIPRRAVRAPVGVGRHQGFHVAIGMLHRLRSVGMCNELLLVGHAVWVLGCLRGGAARGSLGGRLPLRDARGKLDVVVLPAIAVPLRDPTRRQLWWFERGAVVGRGGASHCAQRGRGKSGAMEAARGSGA